MNYHSQALLHPIVRSQMTNSASATKHNHAPQVSFIHFKIFHVGILHSFAYCRPCALTTIKIVGSNKKNSLFDELMWQSKILIVPNPGLNLPFAHHLMHFCSSSRLSTEHFPTGLLVLLSLAKFNFIPNPFTICCQTQFIWLNLMIPVLELC